MKNLPSLEEQPEAENVQPDEILPSSIGERWSEVMQQEAARQGLGAVARLVANGVITIVDCVPLGIGEMPGWAADVAKVVSRVSPALRNLDLSPDVSMKLAVGSEAIEPFTAGAAPSHFLETLLQLKADIQKGRMSNAGDALGYLMTGNDDYLARLAEASAKLDTAAGLLEQD